MKSFFLLVLLLITGWEVQSKRKQCNKWAKLICNNKKSGKYQMPEVADCKSRTPQKIFKVIIKNDKNIKEQNCSTGVNSFSDLYEVKVGVEKSCPKPYMQTAYRTVTTTIRCDRKGKSRVWFFCKQVENFTCVDFITTASFLKSEETFTPTETGSGFSLSISNVSSHHAGLYWCGVKEVNKYRVSVTQLKVKESITNFTKSAPVGENFTYYCKYYKFYNSTKFICKGEDPSTCQHLVSTTKPDMSARFSINDDTANKKISITVREVREADSGTYWCGAESTDKRRSSTFIHRMTLNVGGSGTAHFLIVGAILLTLLLVTAFILFYKRFLHSKIKGNRAAAQHPREDFVHEEIHKNVQKSKPENAVTTINNIAKTPINEPDSMHYATINFQNSSADVEIMVLQPSCSSCLYSTVRPVQP